MGAYLLSNLIGMAALFISYEMAGIGLFYSCVIAILAVYLSFWAMIRICTGTWKF